MNNMQFDLRKIIILFAIILVGTTSMQQALGAETKGNSNPTYYKSLKIDGVDIFYREAGPKDAPTILLLHGFPTSSQMFSCLISELSDKFHLIAPDYPGFGNSDQPSMEEFDYTFDNYSKIMESFLDKLGVKKFSVYLMDYGAPVGFRIAAKHPKRVETLIIQNGNADKDLLRQFWDPIKIYWK